MQAADSTKDSPVGFRREGMLEHMGHAEDEAAAPHTGMIGIANGTAQLRRGHAFRALDIDARREG